MKRDDVQKVAREAFDQLVRDIEAGRPVPPFKDTVGNRLRTAFLLTLEAPQCTLELSSQSIDVVRLPKEVT